MKDEVVDLLTAMGLTMKRKGDIHRARAYMHAANAAARAPAFEQLLEEGRLQEIGGIGPAIDKKITEFARHGKVPEWVDMDLLHADGGEAEGILQAPASYKEAPFPGTPDLHCHTTWSDGTLTLEQVVGFAERLGEPAIGISDHSGSLRIARGLRPDEVRAQWDEIARVQKKHPKVKILKGTECDILRDGRLDHPEEILEGFDYVVGSLHQHLKLDEKAQTERVLAALDSTHLTVLGHPTTRVPNYRPRAKLDLDKVFKKAADKGVAMEINGNPGRIDLDVDLAKKALEHGCMLALSSDGHSAREMLALETARRMAEEAGASETDVVNYKVLGRATGGRADARASQSG